MKLSWNDRYRETIAGLDILGVRQLDQNLEVQLVGGLTTVAPRARYITLVTWALTVLYKRLLSEGDGILHLDDDEQNALLSRLEFLIAAATQADELDQEEGSFTGIIGGDVYRTELDSLASSGSAHFPPSRRPGVLNAYSSPIQAFGLLKQVQESGPLALTPRGQALVQYMAIPPSTEELLFSGEGLASEQLDSLRPHLSLNRLRSTPKEQHALLEALDEPAEATSSSRVGRFSATRAWVIDQLQRQSTDADGLVDLAYADLVSNQVKRDIGLLWGEVALRKRVHFALELLLAALTNSLEPNRGTGVPEVITNLARDLQGQRPPKAIEAEIDDQPIDLSEPWATFQDRVRPDAFLQTPPKRDLAGLPAAWQLVAALSLLAAIEYQSCQLRQSGVVKVRDHQAMEDTFALLEKADGSAAELTARLMHSVVAARHLRHTMRKMSQRQANSLRFFPRGDSLVPTGTKTKAGFSLTRLASVLQVMADIGHLRSTQGGFQPTRTGIDWAHGVFT